MGALAHVAIGVDPKVLMRIHEPHINLAIWERQLTSSITDWLGALNPNPKFISHGRYSGPKPFLYFNQEYPTVSFALEEKILRSTSCQHLAMLPEGERAFLEDVIQCAKIFREIAALNSRLTLRCAGEGREDAESPEFHHDGGGLRLVTTYRGAGTEWLPNNSVKRRSGDSLQDHGIYPPSFYDKEAIRHLGCGDVAIIKGERTYIFGGAERESGVAREPLVHRTPLLSLGVRIVLIIDE